MGKDVYANGNAIACKAGDGKVIAAFPDVCNSPPSPPAGPLPLPYPNSSFSKDLKEGSSSVKIGGKPAGLKDKSYFKSSPLGDEAATRTFGGSLVTHTITGKTYFGAWSMDVKFEGKNVCRHFDITTSNHSSQPGSTPPMPEAEDMSMSTNAQVDECPPHDWVEISRETPEQTKQKNKKQADDNEAKRNRATKPEKKRELEGKARGPRFENKAIEENMEKLKIEATSLVYECKKCEQTQEVDILGESQIAEAKSQNANGVKNSSKQCERLKSINDQLFKDKGSSSPLAKLDGSLPDTVTSQGHYARRGFAIEVL